MSPSSFGASHGEKVPSTASLAFMHVVQEDIAPFARLQELHDLQLVQSAVRVGYHEVLKYIETAVPLSRVNFFLDSGEDSELYVGGCSTIS